MAQGTLSFWLRPRVLAARAYGVQAVLWTGLLFPLAYDPTRTRDQILSRLLTDADLLRGLVPVAALAVGLAWFPVRVRPVSRAEVWLGVFLTLALASAAWSVRPAATLLRAGGLTIEYLLLLFLARLHTDMGVESLSHLGVVIQVIVLSCLGGALLVPSRALAVMPPDTVRRLAGVFPVIAPDILGFCSGVGVVLLAARTGPSWTRRRAAIALLVPADLAALLLTQARAAAALMVVGLLVVLLRSRPRLRVLAGGVLAVVGLGAGAYLVGPARVVALMTRHQDLRFFVTMTGRTSTWREALLTWLGRPFLGYGYYAGHRFALPPHPGYGEVSNVDSMWIETLIDLGVAGVVPLVLLIARAGSALLTLARSERGAAWTRLAIFVMALFASFLNPSLELLGYPMVFLGLVVFGAPRPGLPAAAPRRWWSRRQTVPLPDPIAWA